MTAAISNHNGQQRDTGLKAVGELPWGSHFCIFYETKRDLLDILVPYFHAGITANEYCLWIVAPYEFATVAEARAIFGRAWSEFTGDEPTENIDIVPHQKWFGENGGLDISKAISRFRNKAAEAERRGFAGLRFNGSSAWVHEKMRGPKFRDFEHQVDALIADQRMLAACTFPLALSGAKEILDAVRTHEFAVTLRKGVWKRVEIGDIAAARKEARQMSPKLEQLTFRQREILQRIAEEQNTKEIAALLGISIKTVEAHRVQLMRRLKIDNVPGLVRFAIRTGLVSAES
ncbi:MAG: hypothetical protein QOG48_865 [Verrucomicrobiota bacterium]|jgi:DNA-binding CsgD family transcriptional regulator